MTGHCLAVFTCCYNRSQVLTQNPIWNSLIRGAERHFVKHFYTVSVCKRGSTKELFPESLVLVRSLDEVLLDPFDCVAVDLNLLVTALVVFNFFVFQARKIEVGLLVVKLKSLFVQLPFKRAHFSHTFLVIVGVTLARVGFGNVTTQRRAGLEALRAEAALVLEFVLKFLSI